MPVAPSTPRERQIARLQAADIYDLIVKGVRLQGAIGNRLMRRVIEAYKQGKPWLPILYYELEPGLEYVADAMVIAWLRGYVREMKVAALSFAQTSEPFQKATEFWTNRAGLEDTTALRTSMRSNALQVWHKAEHGVEQQLEQAMERIQAAGMHVREGVQELGAAFEAAGITAQKAHTLEAVYRTQTSMAYAAGQWEADKAPEIAEIHWGYKYVTVGDDRVREEHWDLDGTQAPKDDPFWSGNYPPNGWNCRCQAISIYEPRKTKLPPTQIERNGQIVIPGADPGFAFNPGTLFNVQESRAIRDIVNPIAREMELELKRLHHVWKYKKNASPDERATARATYEKLRAKKAVLKAEHPDWWKYGQTKPPVTTPPKVKVPIAETPKTPVGNGKFVKVSLEDLYAEGFESRFDIEVIENEVRGHLSRMNLDPALIKPSEWNELGVREKRIEQLLKTDLSQAPPILVRKVGDGYEVIDGLHRTEIALRQGRKVSAIVLDPTADEWLSAFADSTQNLFAQWYAERGGIPTLSAPRIKAAKNVVWRKVTTRAAGRREFKRLFPELQVRIRDYTGFYENETQLLRHLNEVGEDFVRVRKEFPNVSFPENFELRLHGKRYLSGTQNGGGVTGSWWNVNNRMSLGAKGLDGVSHKVPTMGRWVTSDTQAALFRHELGHAYQHTWVGGDLSQIHEWNAIYRKHPASVWKKLVSEYGSTGSDELFAECFSAWTSPKYQRGSLPIEVEDFLEKILGKRQVTAPSTAGWAPVKTFDEAKKQLSERYGIHHVYGDASTNMVNKVGEEIENLHQRVRGFRDLPKLQRIDLLKASETPLGNAGEYSSLKHELHLSSARLSGPLREPRFGRWVTGEDLRSDLRHEWGHHILRNGRHVSSNFGKEWGEIWRSRTKERWAKVISKYGSSDPKECFAEAFSAWTSPKYKPGMLPSDVEAYFERHLGVQQVKTTVVEAPAVAEVKPTWTATKSIKEAQDVFKEQFNIKVGFAKPEEAGYGMGGTIPKTRATIGHHEALNDIGEELTRLQNAFPKVTKLRKGVARINVVDAPRFDYSTKIYRTSKETRQSSAIGVMYRSKRVMVIARSNPGEETLRLGRWSAVKGFKGAFRHEFGHHWLNYAPKKAVREWEKLYLKYPSSFEKVSEYAMTNEREAFAEAFSAFTSPKYENGMLSSEIEEYFTKYIAN